jgi:hypothetical protein
MIVGPNTIVELGRKLKACYAGSWSTVTVVGGGKWIIRQAL